MKPLCFLFVTCLLLIVLAWLFQKQVDQMHCKDTLFQQVVKALNTQGGLTRHEKYLLKQKWNLVKTEDGNTEFRYAELDQNNDQIAHIWHIFYDTDSERFVIKDPVVATSALTTPVAVTTAPRTIVPTTVAVTPTVAPTVPVAGAVTPFMNPLVGQAVVAQPAINPRAYVPDRFGLAHIRAGLATA